MTAMISYLRGNIVHAGENFIILEVNGVGYRIFATYKTLGNIKNQVKDVALFIHQHLREDCSDLYGFLSFAELDLFEIITSVSGIGPRIGLAVLEISSLNDIKKAIGTSNVDFLMRIPGIGRKKAELIILELKNKMDVLIDGQKINISEPDADAVNALMRLGYNKHEAKLALEGVADEVKDVGEKVRLALKEIGKK